MKYLSLAACLAATSVAAFAAENALIADAESSTNNSLSAYHPMDHEMYGFTFSGEALYWKSMIQTATVALIQPTDFTGTYTSPVSTSEVNWAFSWAWGYRIGIDYEFDDRNWGVGVQYTQLYAHANLNQGPGLGNSFSSLINVFSGVEGNLTSFVSGRFDNKLNMLDGMIERRYEVGDSIAFYPAFGVKGVWFRQNNHITFTGGDIGGNNLSQKQYCKYSAAGPKVAFASDWTMGYGFGFYENVGLSMLVGNLTSSTIQSYSLGDAFVYDFAVPSRFSCVPAIELNLGLDWVYHFEEIAQSLGINVGVDAQTYLNEYFGESIGDQAQAANTSYFGISLGAFWKF